MCSSSHWVAETGLLMFSGEANLDLKKPRTRTCTEVDFKGTQAIEEPNIYKVG